MMSSCFIGRLFRNKLIPSWMRTPLLWMQRPFWPWCDCNFSQKTWFRPSPGNPGLGQVLEFQDLVWHALVKDTHTYMWFMTQQLFHDDLMHSWSGAGSLFGASHSTQKGQDGCWRLEARVPSVNFQLHLVLVNLPTSGSDAMPRISSAAARRWRTCMKMKVSVAWISNFI